MTLREQLATDQARDQFILDNMKLVSAALKTFLSRHPHLGYLKDDIRSAGTLGLVEAVDSLRQGTEPDKPGLYLTFAIQRAIREAIDDEDTVHIPTRTKQLIRHNGHTVVPVKTDRLATEPLANESPLFDLADEILSACQSERDRQIVSLRAKRHTLAEVGEAVGIHFTRVSHTLSDIRTRLNDNH